MRIEGMIEDEGEKREEIIEMMKIKERKRMMKNDIVMEKKKESEIMREEILGKIINVIRYRMLDEEIKNVIENERKMEI